MRSIGQNNFLIGCLCASGCEILYGLSYVFTKQATVSVSAFALLGWRFFIAVMVINLCVAARIIKIDLKGKSLKPLILLALFSPCIYCVGETLGISRTTASESGVFLACIPIGALIASTLILRKKPSGLQITGILITLAGVVVTVVAVGAASSLSFAGYAFLLVAIVSYALCSVFVEKATTYSGAEITYSMLTLGSAVFVILAMAEALSSGTVGQLVALPFHDRSFLTAVLYQGIGCSVVAFFLTNVAIAKIGVNRTASFIGISTVVAIAAGAILLKETVTGWRVIGAVVILIGVYTANARRGRVS